MVDIFRYHAISESAHRVLNPLSAAKLDVLGRICRLGSGPRQLDLACGKGEMLCRYAAEHGITGVGIDLYQPHLAAARARAAELGVAASIRFVEGDAGDPGDVGSSFDVVSCIGATWIGGGLDGTLELMMTSAAPSAWLMVGEVFWAAEPPPAVRAAQETTQTFADLAGTLDRFETAGVELVEMVLASSDDWDRYQASQWLAASDWVAAHPDDPDADEITSATADWRRSYLSHLRAYMGWGVFVGRMTGSHVR